MWQFLCALDLATKLSASGLFLDLVGIVLLFWFQVDRNHALREDGTQSISLEQHDETESATWKKYRRLTIFGFLLLMLGFTFQIAGTLVGAG